MAYLGYTPQFSSRVVYKYTTSAGVTVIGGSVDDSGKQLSYIVGQVQVFKNGILLNTSQYTAINGSSITLGSSTSLNDVIVIYAEGTVGIQIPFNSYGVHGADIASASTINLENATGDIVDVTGTTTITAITLSEGHQRTVRFTGSLTLTNGASLVLPSGSNITTGAGDFAIFRGYASGLVRCISYVPASQANMRTLAGFGIGSTIAGTNTWQNTQTFTVAPVFTDKTNTRLAFDLNQGTALSASQNFNSVTAAGTYYTIDTNSTNAPVSSTSWYLSVIASSTTSNIKQIATKLDVSGSESYIRARISGTWDSWHKILYGDDNLASLTNASTAKTNLGLVAIASSGSASDLSSGTVPTARLGSGSASSSSVLFGDQTYKATSVINPFGLQLLHCGEEQNNNVSSSALMTNNWNTQPINITRTNEISGSSISSNQITLPSGVYWYESWHTYSLAIGATQTGQAAYRLQNITDSTQILNGTRQSHSIGGGTNVYPSGTLHMRGRFTLASTKVIAVQIYTILGQSVGPFNGNTKEVYNDIMIWKLS